jgi:hypothetical protein
LAALCRTAFDRKAKVAAKTAIRRATNAQVIENAKRPATPFCSQITL